MNKKAFGLVAVTGACLLLAPGLASASDVGVTAVVNSTTVTGSRSITTVPASLTMSSAAAGAVTGALTVAVTEVTMAGLSASNPWKVTSQLTGNLLNGSNSIPSSSLSLSPTSATSTNLDLTVAAVAGAANQSLSHTASAAAELFRVTGESPSALYTGVYTGVGTISLTIPSGTVSGSYTATMTVTLIQ